MNDKFDELAKGLAQSVTRRAALKKFGVGVAGIALASLGLANKAEAAKRRCSVDADCGGTNRCLAGVCVPRSKYCEKARAACSNCSGPPYGCDPLDENCINDCWGVCITCGGGGG